MSRDIHLVGSVPMASARNVFEQVSAALGTRIKRLPDGETGERADWIPRAKFLLQFAETRAFAPFDRQGHVRNSEGKSLPQLLDEFARARSESLHQLRALNLGPEDLERRGRHPAFGPVTLSQHLASWAVHDLTHLHQVSRIMAHQYRDAVGPWSAYLGVLKCAGHSSPA